LSALHHRCAQKDRQEPGSRFFPGVAFLQNRLDPGFGCGGEMSWIGKPVRRIEDERLLKGQAISCAQSTSFAWLSIGFRSDQFGHGIAARSAP
jgi:hypothetical protein